MACDRYGDADTKENAIHLICCCLCRTNTYHTKYVTKKNCVPFVEIQEEKIIAEYIFVLIRICFVALTHF